MPKKIEISHRTIIFTVAFLASLWFLYYIRDILLQIFVALLIMTILNPMVVKLEKYKIPRLASILLVYTIVISFIGFTFAAVIPPLVEQSADFSQNVPVYMAHFNIPDNIVTEISSQLSVVIRQLPTQLVRLTISIASNIITVLSVMFFALYFLLSRNKLDDQMATFLQRKEAERIDKVLGELEKYLGGWARGQLLLMLIVGFTTYIGLVILGIPYAVPLALLAGLFEIVPNIGPFIAAFPAVIVGFGVSPLTGLATASLSFLIQQVENYILVPKIMERSAGVNPIVTLTALLIGFRVAGILGAIMSVPVVITIRVIASEYLFHAPKENK